MSATGSLVLLVISLLPLAVVSRARVEICSVGEHVIAFETF